MLFDVHKDAFSDLCSGLTEVQKQVENEISIAKSKNSQALDGGEGSWTEGATGEFVAVTSGLMALGEGIDDLSKACKDALDELNGTVSSLQSAVVDAAGASLSDTQRLYCDDSAAVGSSVDAASNFLGTFVNKVNDAKSAASSLNNDGGEVTRINSALDDLKQGIVVQQGKVHDVNTAWNPYVGEIDNFNGNFQGQFSKQIVTSDSLAMGQEAVVRLGMDEISTTKDPKKANGSLKKLTKFMDMCLDVDEQCKWGKSGQYRKAYEELKELARKGENLSKDDFKKLAATKSLLLTSAQEGGRKNLKTKIKGVVDFSEGKQHFANAKSSVTPKHELAHGALGVAGKTLGMAGIALNVVGTAEDAGNAYRLAKGDHDDKLAAGATEAVADGLDIGVNYGAGAAIGFVFGGPVGSVVGVGLGMVVSNIWEGQKKKKWYKNLKNDVHDGLDSMFHKF